MYTIGIYFKFTVAMVTKMADKIGIKIEKMPFLTKFKAFRDRVFKN